TYNPGVGPYPVVGDWDNDLDDTVGVKAGTSWLLNNANDSSAPDITFAFGLANDFPLVGGGTASANAAPVVQTTAAALNYAENAGPVAADGGVAVTDPDSPTLGSATVAITSNFVSAQDELAFSNQLGITGSYNDATGVMTLTGPASPASFQTALRAVTYENVSNDPNPPSRQLTFVASDGSLPSAPATRTINITAVNDAPVVTASAGSAAFTVGGSPVVVDSGLMVADPDSAQLSGATVTISANLTAGDALSFTPAGSINGVGAGTGTLTLSGAATPAQYQAVLRSVTYQGTTATPATRTISFRVTDSAGSDSNIATRGVTVAAAGNSAPVVTTTGGSTAYTEGAAAVTVDSGVTVVDSDDANLAGAQVRISAGFEAGDALTFTPSGGAGGAGSSYDAGTGVLTLTGTGTVAEFQTVLRSVQFNSTSENPAVSKTVEFKVDDGDVDSNLATKAIAVTRVNDGPVADDETFGNNLGFGSALGNTRFVVGTTSTGPRLTVPGDVLDGDTDPDTPAANLTAGPASITSTQCAATCAGNVTMQADGQFTYDPKPGFTGSDTFTYTVSDNSAVAPANQTATGTVTVWVSGPLVWYVDGDAPAPAAGRAGTSHAPANTLSALNTGGSLDGLDGSGDYIFVYDAASPYTGGIVLEQLQRLIGEPNGLDVFVGASGNPTNIVPAGGGSNPVIVNASGDGVNLSFGNEIQGIDLGNASGAALFGNFISSATMGTQTPGAIDNQTVGGQAVNISLGTLNMKFTSVSSTGGQHAIRLDHTQGNFTADGGTLSNTTDTDVVITGNNSFDDIAFTYGGAISDDSGPLIRIANQSGGNKRFTGPITDLPATPDNGGGILLQNNFGGGSTNNIHFDGGLTLSTGTSDAVVNDNGGTLAITDPGGVGVGVDNTLATTTGIALNLDYATIHDDDLTFRSITSNGAPSAIRLNNVFNVNGRLNVTGNGGACSSAATCSGGAIQNSTGDGISLGGVLGRVSLSRMQVSEGGAHGIHATAADGVALSFSRIVDNGDAADEHGLAYENVAGVWSIADTLVTGSADNNLRLANTTTFDPLAVSLDITGSTFASNSTTTGGYGAEVLGGSEGSADVNITGSTFAANREAGLVVDGGVENTTINARLKSNTVTGGNPGAVTSESGISVRGSMGGQTTAEIDDNTISGTRGRALFVVAPPEATAGSRLDATITNNTIGDGTALSGAELDDAVVAQNSGSGESRFALRSNTVRNYAGSGLSLFASGTATADFTVTQNTMGDPSATVRPGVDVRSGNLAGDTTIMCADIGGAGVENSLGAAGPSGQADVELHRESSADLRLPGFTTGGNAQAYIAGRNLGSPTTVVTGLAPSGLAGGCSLPTLPPP
ncbi:MAG: Ig-like domain-containing protein, partial [Solirubrobacteraceae bacterium]|nr:Ig-like domain-containing protein [Solirubrobacteraceae bacterium]